MKTAIACIGGFVITLAVFLPLSLGVIAMQHASWGWIPIIGIWVLAAYFQGFHPYRKVRK